MDLFELKATLGLDSSAFTAGLQAAGKLVTSFARTVGKFGKDVIQTGMDFDEQMSAVQAVLGKTEGTMENMNRLREFGLDQARGSIFTAEETAKAYYYMGMAGWKTEEMLAGLPGILDLAAASGESLSMVSDIVTDSLTAFGWSAGRTSEYVDILAQTATNSNTDVRRMGQTFKYVAPIAGALGYEVDDVALSIGLLASAGIKGSQAGTTLRNIFTRISTNAGQTSKDLGALDIVTQKLGVDFYDAEGKARDWGDVLMEMRAAWRGMDEESRTGLIDTFNDYIESGKDADTTLREFSEDVERALEISKKLEKQESGEVWDSMAESIGEIGSQYDELLQMLDIPIPTYPEEYAEALDQARIKLGEMSDAEKISFAKQMASMRGMPGLLRMLEAEEDDVRQLVNAYEDSAGAAEAMAGIRLDNLAGDVKLFNAAWDVMKIRIFDDVKGPLREVVQMGSDAINSFSDAIKRGEYEEGIKQLGQDINEIAEYIKPTVEEFATAITPILTELVKVIAPAAIKLGEAIGEGVITGIGNALGPTGQTAVEALFGITFPKDSVSAAVKDLQGTVISDYTQVPAELIPEIHPQKLYNQIRDAAKGETIELPYDLKITKDAAKDLLSAITSGEYKVPVDADASSMPGDITSAVDSVGTLTVPVQGVWQGISGLFHSGGGGSIIQGGGGHFAKATYGGRILHGATVFGMDSKGGPLVGGESSPEAVVGVGSLHQMINDSVSGAFSGMLDRLDGMIDRMPGGNMRVVLDTGALVGGLVSEMDMSLNDRAVWKGYGRTL